MTTFTRTPGQDGAALITSLIFLTILTLLGMSSMGTALLENRMAGNSRDRNLAFQAAEMGMRDAEAFILYAGRIEKDMLQSLPPNDMKSDTDGSACLYGFCINHNGSNIGNGNKVIDLIAQPVWENEANWANALQYQRNDATTEKGVGRGSVILTVKPAYVLPAALPLVSAQPEYLIESLTKPGDYDGYNYFYYRITVRGYGMRSGTRVILQEVYRRLFLG